MRFSKSSGFLFALLTLLAAPAANDPRAEIVQLHLKQDSVAALERIDELSEKPGTPPPGLSYLKARLLLAEGRHEAAEDSLGKVMAEKSALAPWATYRLALTKESTGHPAVAAGLAAGLMGARPPKSLIEPTANILHRSLSVAGDCRVLDGLVGIRFKERVKRRLLLAKAACFRRADDPSRERAVLEDLLADDTTDDSAHFAAVRLEELITPAKTPTAALIDIGTAFFHHRDFELSSALLSRALSRPEAALPLGNRALPESLSPTRILDTYYALARSHFWLGHYQRAATLFARVAREAPKKRLAAKAVYQQARCHELAGAKSRSKKGARVATKEKTTTGWDDWKKATVLFTQVALIDPSSGWASAAKIGRMRLHWMMGETEKANAALSELGKKGSAENFARASLFLAVSDLVQGRSSEAARSLERIQKSRRIPDYEIELWLGRKAELEDRPRDAVEHYLKTLAADPFHPFAEAARQRLTAEPLAPAVQETADWLAAGPDSSALYKAWLLLGDSDPRGAKALKALRARLERLPRAATFLEMSPLPVDAWPLWTAGSSQPEEILLTLGLFDEAGTPVLRHFPTANPSAALAGSISLAQRAATRRSLYIAEILLKRKPRELPLELLSEDFHQLLYPFRYSFLLMREATKHEIDPYLLAGLIREESRFDAEAFSAASARGLTQFIYPTAREIAESIELGPITPWDIHRPEIAIALGAGYLKQLLTDLDGNLSASIAAYNAGEPQAELWQHYCFSDEPAELWSKIAFKETRNYVRKVLTSRNHYRALYGKVTPPPSASVASADDGEV